MDYETLIENLVCWSKASHIRSRFRYALGKAANAITDLLVENQLLRNAANGFKDRAERAEARCKTLEKMVKEYQDEIVPGYRESAENAEIERDDAISDLETIMFIGDSGLDTCDFCKNNQCYARSGNNPCLPKWRGIKEETE